MTCRALGPLLMAGGSRERAASARCAALKYNVWSASQEEGYWNSGAQGMGGLAGGGGEFEGWPVSSPLRGKGAL